MRVWMQMPENGDDVTMNSQQNGIYSIHMADY